MTQDLAQLPATWAEAIDAFAIAREIRRIFRPDLIDNMLATKRQELHYMAELSEDERRELYLDTV
jgi:glutamine synthetase